MAQPVGCFSLILHGHIPYVLGHGTWPHGSMMIMEAAADTYIPLLWAVEELAAEGIAAKITLGLTPVTMEQLADERFKDWFVGYVKSREHMAGENSADFAARGDGHLAWLAQQWQERFRAIRESFCDRYNRDLLAQFKMHQDEGRLEIMCSAATHGYLPLLHEDGSIQGQIRQGVATYERFMGRRPRGFWLPECAYRPRCTWAPSPQLGTEAPWQRTGLEEFLAANGYDYFPVDSHLVAGGDPLPVDISRYHTLGKLWGQIRRMGDGTLPGDKTPYRPYFVGHHFEDHPPVACFFRDPTTSDKVWSGAVGYPGDFQYLDFHKKHMPGDHRYWKVTDDSGDLGAKQPYDPAAAEERVQTHAGNFLWTVKETLRHAPHNGDRLPVVAAPFDAELFGHWWYEGPRWLVHVLRWMHADPEIKVQTASEYLQRNEPESAITLPEGSWGAGGGHWVWLNEDTEWSWHRIYDAEIDMQALLRDHGPGHDETMRELVRQCARELLLLQASDWQFLITTWSARDYAEARLDSHHSDYKKCADMARRYGRGERIEPGEWEWFGNLCDRDRLFADVDPTWFSASP